MTLQEKAIDPLPLALHAGRVHKLRGSAGTPGAKDIQHLAGAAEAACMAADRNLAADLCRQLAAQLQRLRDRSMAAPPGTEVIAPAVPAAFIVLLRQQSLSALGTFDARYPHLRCLLQEGRYAVLRGLVDDLKFAEAAQALEDSIA